MNSVVKLLCKINICIVFGIICAWPSPDNLKQALGQAEKFMEEEDYAKAISNYKIAQKLEPENPMILAGLAEAYEYDENWSSARDVYKVLVDMFPKDYRNISRYLKSLKKSGTIQGQKECYKKLFEMNPKDMVQAINYLKFMEKQGSNGADPDYVQVLEELSMTPGSHLFFANMLGQAQMEELAVDNQNRDSQLGKKMEFHKTIAAINKLQKTKIDTAKFQQKLMALITSTPNDETLLEAQGILYFFQGNYSHAKIFFNNMKNPSPTVHGLLAKIYFKRENYKEAISHFSKIPEEKRDQKTWEQYCDALASENQKQKAKKEYQKLLKAYPQSEEGKKYLATNK